MQERPLDRILFESGLVTIGSFRAEPGDPRFPDSGPAEAHIFVFPRTSVVIQHEGQPSFTTDSRTVTYYNRGQRYTRGSLDPRGDRCEWFAPRPEELRTALAHHDPSVSARPRRPFAFSHGPSDPPSYALQRQVVRHVTTCSVPDAFAVEEAVFSILDRITGLARRQWAGRGRHPAQDSWSDRSESLAEEARRVLIDRFRDALSLADVAETVGSSVFHLCRVFRSEVGTTIHRYRHELRLRHSLELVAERTTALTEVALDLGFSSHSHFSAAFRAAFGTTPSEFRRHPSSRRIHEAASRLATAV